LSSLLLEADISILGRFEVPDVPVFFVFGWFASFNL
jgi:hypothetical protein